MTVTASVPSTALPASTDFAILPSGACAAEPSGYRANHTTGGTDMRILRTVVVSVATTAVLASAAACGGPEAPDNPRGTLTKLTGYIADDDGEAACELMLEPVRDTFASDNDATSCEKAVSSLSAKVTDKAAYKAMVPDGLKVDGDTAEVSGYCGKGWKAPGGADSKLTFTPNRLGTLTLKKTDDGWFVSEYKGAKHYSSCGG
jgi:hypothetical protein